MAIKDFLKNIGQNVKEATNKVSGKIDDTLDVQKLKYRITKKEEEISSIHQKLGERVIAAVYAEEDFEEDIVDAIAKIEALREEIAQMNTERMAKEHKILCPKCGKELSQKCEFCPHCGAKLVNEEGESGDSTEETPAE